VPRVLPRLLLGLLLLGVAGFKAPVQAAEAGATDVQETRRRAESGDAESQLELGSLYFAGQGVPQHYGEALKWYRRAAEQGNAAAQNNLAAMYLKGQGVPANPVEGAKWLQKAAGQGFARAQLNLGALFTAGIGVGRNLPEALRWFQRAANQGDAEGQRRLGEVYTQGQMVRQDLVEAYKWFNLAAAQGDKEAVEARDLLAQSFTAKQLADGQRRAAAFTPRPDSGASGPARSSGTGFFVTEDGCLLTAYHVVESPGRIVIQTRKLRYAAQLVKADKTNDIALLKVTGAYPVAGTTNRPSRPRTNAAVVLRADRTNTPLLLKVSTPFKALPVTGSTAVKLGDAVSTLGFPNVEVQGREPKLTRGEISSLAGFRDDARHFQISAPVQPGSSGGPLFDSLGNVIGMVVRRLDDLSALRNTGMVAQNVNYALKGSRVVEWLNALPAVKDRLKPAVTAADEGSAPDWVASAQEAVVLIQVH
jgi:uncharacterized protein